jgi:hypothetical protein
MPQACGVRPDQPASPRHQMLQAEFLAGADFFGLLVLLTAFARNMLD